MKQVNGWHLPAKDGYFSRFVEGGPRKRNGFQRQHLELAFTHVREWDVAIDVGAHVGFWTVDMAARFDHVFAFEPAADTYECLVKNTQGLANVTCFNAAVGPFDGICEITEDPLRKGNTGARYIVAGQGKSHMIALDDLIFAGCDLLKIDVEGFEPGVLRGARALIQAYKPVVILETDKNFRHRFGFAKHQAESDMLELGYSEVKYLELDKRQPDRQINAIRPDRIFVPDA